MRDNEPRIGKHREREEGGRSQGIVAQLRGRSTKVLRGNAELYVTFDGPLESPVPLLVVVPDVLAVEAPLPQEVGVVLLPGDYAVSGVDVDLGEQPEVVADGRRDVLDDFQADPLRQLLGVELVVPVPVGPGRMFLRSGCETAVSCGLEFRFTEGNGDCLTS